MAEVINPRDYRLEVDPDAGPVYLARRTPWGVEERLHLSSEFSRAMAAHGTLTESELAAMWKLAMAEPARHIARRAVAVVEIIGDEVRDAAADRN